ncbi:hypothetical protein [Candidatus Viridilinea mediisalina]|uniref:Uncharacterized protein n=1 Tax=Candidatus Viridilinea mediisalina TaxID=2024553 RepID=A0A2A6RI83_9CHLR|nr:hypothetical protein [Candidatus Viridilinea mediisalina]PDW02589.1 hypothetical protein CJ255_13125 [Candidatus Viridilinea mediisalina]
MLHYSIFWLVVFIFVLGQAILIRAAWRLRRAPAPPPLGVPRSPANADFAWTLLTALLTALLLYGVYVEL